MSVFGVLSLLMSNAWRHFFKNIMLTLLTFVNLEEKTYLYTCFEKYNNENDTCLVTRDDGKEETYSSMVEYSKKRFCNCLDSCWYDEWGAFTHVVHLREVTLTNSM